MKDRYIEELETRVDRQRHRIISLQYDLDRIRTQASVFSKKTLKIFTLLGFREEDVIDMYRTVDYVEEEVYEA